MPNLLRFGIRLHRMVARGRRPAWELYMKLVKVCREI